MQQHIPINPPFRDHVLDDTGLFTYQWIRFFQSLFVGNFADNETPVGPEETKPASLSSAVHGREFSGSRELTTPSLEM
ncbi:MAG: hypothetical protein JWO13_2748 [Acidobacteriales bacterium]|nr:hypothetical protein [Terriglobales bacterium]